MKSINKKSYTKVNHITKLWLLFTNPINLFKTIKSLGTKNTDWIIPVIFAFSCAFISDIVLNNNPQIKEKVIERKVGFVKIFYENIMNEDFDKEIIDDRVEEYKKTASGGIDGESIAMFIIMIVVLLSVLFIQTTFYYLIYKIFFKIKSGYTNSLTIVGLSFYVLGIHAIFIMFASIYTGYPQMEITPFTFIGGNKTLFGNFTLSMFDPFKIWFYIIVGLGFSILFDINKIRSIAAIFISWIVLAYGFFFLSKAYPLFEFFI